MSWEKEAVIIYYTKIEVAILLHSFFCVDVHMCIHFSAYVKIGKGKDQYYFRGLEVNAERNLVLAKKYACFYLFHWNNKVVVVWEVCVFITK